MGESSTNAPLAAEGRAAGAVVLDYARGETLGAPPAPVRPLTHLRLWFVVFLLWMGGLAALASHFFQRFEAGDAAAQGPWVLALMCFYLSLCNVFFPAPTAWIILLTASDSVGLFGDAWPRIVLTAVAGAAATTMANLNEYHILGYFFASRLGERIRHTKLYAWAADWFDKAPFQTLGLIALVPIPIDAVRWLAILRRYPRPRFAGAYFLGRCVRYALFASCSVVFALTPRQIIIIQVAIVLVVAARLVLQAFLKPKRRQTA